MVGWFIYYVVTPTFIVGITVIFCCIFYTKLTTPHPDLMRKQHRHPENKRRKRREALIKKEVEYFQEFKSDTSDLVRGFNSERKISNVKEV